MSAHQQPGEPLPHVVIVEALARIAAYPALVFVDERATDEAGDGFRRARRIVRYQPRRVLPALATPIPPRWP